MQKDEGVIYKLTAFLMLFWAVLCWGILLSITKAGYTNQYLQDALTQANLAALVVDPYYYGSTGELIFESADKIKLIFEEALEEGVGSTETRNKLGIKGDVMLKAFHIYEVTSHGIRELKWNGMDDWKVELYNDSVVIKAPDGTNIESSAIYAQIAVPVEFLFGVEVIAIKEHCVDIVSEGIKNE